MPVFYSTAEAGKGFMPLIKEDFPGKIYPQQRTTQTHTRSTYLVNRFKEWLKEICVIV